MGSLDIHVHDDKICPALREATLLSAVCSDEDYADESNRTTISVLV